MKKENILIALFVLLILGALVFVTKEFNKEDNNNSTSPTNLPQANSGQVVTPTQTMKKLDKSPAMQIDAKSIYMATVKTSVGDMVIALNAKQTPITVNNFVTLARGNFYNNTIFHRVIKGFMIQGGDPKGDGTGGPGYKFNDEPFTGDYTRGTIAMANAGPNTNGSQFFILQQDNALPKNYVIFGKVVVGLDVVDTIADAPVESNGMGEQSKPVNPVKILSIQITQQ